MRRTTAPQQRALVGWLDTVRRIGKGQGKRVPRLLVEASQKMTECREVVPVWIMPLTRAVEAFESKTRFDVVICDEASQADVMALIPFYMASRVVVVGDHEQVSPTAVGQDLTAVQQLIDEHLADIPNAVLYDGQMSVYDLARQSFGGTICLTEHFRCVPDVIEFSNHLCYSGNIRALRDPSQSALRPHVVSHRVRRGRCKQDVNPEEALEVVALIQACTQMPEYKGKSFGVISLVGDAQALLIERLLLHRLTPSEFEARRILCGNAAQFQGDERDVMFLSVVDSPGEGPLRLRSEPMFKQRFNVASSRARDQMWVVHSLEVADLKPKDLRRLLLQHAEDPGAMAGAKRAAPREQFELQRECHDRLFDLGYRVKSDFRVGGFSIDLVVEGAERKLGVECIGDRPRALDRIAEDVARQSILERLGWTFTRIRATDFYRDSTAALAPTLARLRELRIEPLGAETKRPLVEGPGLKERVLQRAAELRQQWADSDAARSARADAPAPKRRDLKKGPQKKKAPAKAGPKKKPKRR